MVRNSIDMVLNLKRKDKKTVTGDPVILLHFNISECCLVFGQCIQENGFKPGMCQTMQVWGGLHLQHTTYLMITT